MKPLRQERRVPGLIVNPEKRTSVLQMLKDKTAELKGTDKPLKLSMEAPRKSSVEL